MSESIGIWSTEATNQQGKEERLGYQGTHALPQSRKSRIPAGVPTFVQKSEYVLWLTLCFCDEKMAFMMATYLRSQPTRRGHVAAHSWLRSGQRSWPTLPQRTRGGKGSQGAGEGLHEVCHELMAHLMQPWRSEGSGRGV